MATPDNRDPERGLRNLKEKFLWVMMGIFGGGSFGIAAIDLLANQGQLSSVGETAAAVGLVSVVFTSTVLFMNRRGWLP